LIGQPLLPASDNHPRPVSAARVILDAGPMAAFTTGQLVVAVAGRFSVAGDR